MSVTDDEVARVLAAPKHIAGRVEWTLRAGRTPKYESDFSVHSPVRGDPQPAVIGRIVASSDQYRTRCAFIYNGICIRRWESTGRHRNPDGELILGEHKHRWDEAHEDRWAYVPDDIDATSRHSALDSFMVECGITIEGTDGWDPEPSGSEADA